jgi:hypothetical protein
MNRDEITRMAREAGIKLPDAPFPATGLYTLPDLIHFAALVAAAERRECAALADAQRSNTNVLLSYPTQSSAAYNIGIAIRARGKG